MIDELEGMMTTEEAAAELKISQLRVRQLVDKGALEGVRVGKGSRALVYVSAESVKQRKENPVKPGRPKN